jgi:hypothetical protein
MAMGFVVVHRPMHACVTLDSQAVIAGNVHAHRVHPGSTGLLWQSVRTAGLAIVVLENVFAKWHTQVLHVNAQRALDIHNRVAVMVYVCL